MALDTFKPEIWSAKIQQDLEKLLVGAEFCNREYEGEVKAAGDTVRILDLARPTITTTTDGAPITISAHEALVSSAIYMQIKQQSWFSQIINDSDKRQGISGVLEKIMSGGNYALANAMDSHIFAMASDTDAVLDAASAYQLTADNILTKIDAAAQELYENNVPANTPMELVLTPRAFTLFRQAYMKADTDNSNILANGKVAQYGGITIKMSNNVATASAGAVDLMILRTKNAIAFIDQINNVETGRSELAFGDYIRGLALYQAKIAKPKEMIVMNCKYTA